MKPLRQYTGQYLPSRYTFNVVISVINHNVDSYNTEIMRKYKTLSNYVWTYVLSPQSTTVDYGSLILFHIASQHSSAPGNT